MIKLRTIAWLLFPMILNSDLIAGPSNAIKRTSITYTSNGQLYLSNVPIGGFSIDLSEDVILIEDTVDQTLAEVNNFIQTELPNFDSFSKWSAEANNISIRGITVDYADEIDYLSLGVGAGGAIAPFDEKISLGGDSNFGFAAGSSIALGLNMGWLGVEETNLLPFGHFDLSESIIFVNFFTFGYAPQENIAIDTTSFGFHLSFHIMDGAETKASAFQWGESI